MKLVHKHHCKKLALAKEGEGGDLVNIFSNHPFSVADLLNDPLEALPMLVQKILLKIQNSNQPAFTRVQSQLIQIKMEVEVVTRITRASKKLYPRKFKEFWLHPHLFLETASIEDKDLVGQDLWLTLHLVWGRLHDSQLAGMVNNMKNPKQAVPEEFWIGIQQEMGPFPSRVAELIKALSGTGLPSFQELLKIFCGGSLLQACSVCKSYMIVAAVYGEVKGCFVQTPSVSLRPYLPPLFSCGDNTCAEEIASNTRAYYRWYNGIVATYVKLRPNKCDNCFKLTEEVHRCGKCLTKNYCSKDCQQKDWEEKHQKLCKDGAEEWKVKGGLEAREKAGLEKLEYEFQKSLKQGASRPKKERDALAEAKEVVEKKGSTVKAGRRSGEKSHGDGKKSDDGGKKSDDGEKKSVNGGQKSNDGGKKSNDGEKKSNSGGKKSNGGGKKSGGVGEKSSGGGKVPN